MRIVFAGTPEFAVPSLRVAAQRGEVVAVYTQPDRPAGRGRGLQASPVKLEAVGRGIPVFQPESLRDPAAQEQLRALQPDLMVVVAYGLILPKAVLAIPTHGCWNVHASLLPRWRGAAPIQRAIMAGDRETGMMVMKMDVGLDTGPVAATVRLPIGPDETAGELHDRLSVAGASLMVESMVELEAGRMMLVAQPSFGVTYAAKIDKAETRIDWSLPAEAVHNHIRGLSPMPGAWCELEIAGRRERLKLLRSTRAEGAGVPGTVLDDSLTVACGAGAVRLVEVQRAGGKPVGAQEFLRGTRLSAGDRLW